ncbi:hypothetical protein BDW59DRAFT_144799 [Aspergillus cavernicola]|uniref:Fe2OG dioxygenase domain-containing protein n=1 Tax=Aspergillus cavernicola TaxID=176166 RepID=A0ABR4IGF9_9EURO
MSLSEENNLNPNWDLKAARIKSLKDAFYIADFISEVEEDYLLQKISSAPLPLWKSLSHRRLQTYPSPLSLSSNTLLAAPLPAWLTTPIVTPHFDALGLFAESPHKGPNHVLVNEYKPGQGIMPHEDGGAYYPLVATVSLGAGIVLDLYDKEIRDGGDEDDCGGGGGGRRPKFRILQERRSLLVTRDRIYRDYLHGIEERERDEGLSADSICNWDLLREPERYQAGWYTRETRISLTYRDVLKVAKLGNTMKFLNKR